MESLLLLYPLVLVGAGFLLGRKFPVKYGAIAGGAAGLAWGAGFVQFISLANSNVEMPPFMGAVGSLMCISIPVAFGGFGVLVGDFAKNPKTGRLVGLFIGSLVCVLYILFLSFALI